MNRSKQKIQILSLLFSLVLLLTLIPCITFAEPTSDATVSEESILYEGKCGNNLKWTLATDGTLTISGTGDMTSVPWSDYKDQIKKLVIEEGVTSIKSRAFYNCDNLTGELIIPKSITKIESYAFNGCENLTGDLKIPQNVTSIGSWAFSKCTGLTGELTICDNIKEIEPGVFSWCENLTGDLIIPEGVTSIGSWAFFGCSSLTGNLIIPSEVTTIGSDAFFDCSGLDGKLVIPDNVTKIESYTFNGCENLTGDLIIPTGVTTIGSHAFSGCSGLNRKLVIPDSVTKIESYAFNGCENLTGDLIIPTGITTIGSHAFSGCNGLNGKLVIPDSVTKIESYAFNGCENLTGDLIIPTGVTTIASHAFSGCNGLNGKLVIPDSVTKIESYAFNECENLTGDLIIPTGVTAIGSYAFSNCSRLTGKLVIPNNVTKIESGVFQGCKNLTGDLIIPENTTSVDSCAFSDCSGLNGNLVIPKGVTSIGLGAFSGCSALNGKLIIPDSVTEIGSYSFSWCENLTGDLIIPTGVTTIASHAFSGCSRLSGKLVIPDNVTKIESSAFENCNNMKSVYIYNANCYIYDKSSILFETMPKNAVIYGYANSTAQEYASKYYQTFRCIEHNWNKDYTIDKEPTCTKEGLKSIHCSVCSATKDNITIEKVAHTYSNWITDKVATCTTPGQKHKTCRICGNKEIEFTPTTEHIYEWVIDKPASKIETGLKHEECSLCKVKRNENTIIDKLPNIKNSVSRVFGSDRIDTSIKAADRLKEELGVDKFENIVVATAYNFADALPGSYVAAEKNAPILLIDGGDNYDKIISEYINKNMASNGTVYILGGIGVVPDKWLSTVKVGTVKRLGGDNRYKTNLAILRSVQVEKSDTVMVCTGMNFADSLSASATGNPILLVDGNLTAEQKAYLDTIRGCDFCMIGGTGAVPESIANELAKYDRDGKVERAAGKSRFETSIAVAERFISDSNPDNAVLAYGYNYPDGLSGGSLAYATGAPLILTASNAASEYNAAKNYIGKESIKSGYILGGPALISDNVIRTIFGIAGSIEIPRI